MDPSHSQRDSRIHENARDLSLGDRSPGASGSDPAANTRNRDVPDSGNPQETDRQPRYSNGFTIIQPNHSQRRKMQTMAQKEEEDLQRWRETNRAGPVHLNPEKLGGNVTLAEARRKQQIELQCSKVQRKLRKEELDKRRRQEEEEALQKMKTEKREMAERLEERRRQEEQRRGEQLIHDHIRTNDSFMQRFERRALAPQASGGATRSSSRKEDVGSKLREEANNVREVQVEHQKVNSAFLDKLEGQSRGSKKEAKGGSIVEAEDPCFTSEDFRHKQSNTPGQFPLTHLDTGPEQSCSGWTEEADPKPDYDWALMKLVNHFPDCSRVFLEDILNQCNGDYEQAYTLLN